jgi:LysM repeat protein
MAETVRIPIDDGGWIEVDSDDPRAIEYLRRFRGAGSPPPRAQSGSHPRTPRQAPSGVYTVQPGDTLAAIAQDLLGDPKLYVKLAELNRVHDPNMILVGQHLLIPERSAPSAGNGTGVGGSNSGTPRGPGSASGGVGQRTGSATVVAKPLNGTSPAGGSGGATLALARGFMFVFFEQLPEVGVGARIIRKVAVVPKNYAFPIPSLGPNFGIRVPGAGALLPRRPGGSMSAVDHMLNVDPAGSPFLSASDRAFASGSIEGTPLLIDVAKIKAAGGEVLTVDELVAELAIYAAKNPSSHAQLQKLMWTVSKIEGEVLIRGGVPRGAAVPITGPAHLGMIRSAEGLWQDFKFGKISKLELEQGLVDLERAYGRARVVGRVGRVFTVVGVLFTAYDLEQATDRSYTQHSVKPLAAEVIRQVGGWGGAAAGAKIGAVLGAACGVETGPGAIVTGAIGAIVFGGLGYFGADLIADQISPN